MLSRPPLGRPTRTTLLGHSKAEYFSAGRGALIVSHGREHRRRRRWTPAAPQPIQQVGIGLAISVVAALLNLAVAIVLLRRVGVSTVPPPLQASAHHLLTDVWTTAGVLVGVGAVALDGWLAVLDPLVAIAVAVNIVWGRRGASCASRWRG